MINLKKKLLVFGASGLTGKNGGKAATLTDIAIKVPSYNTQFIQESHIMIGHIIMGFVESSLP